MHYDVETFRGALSDYDTTDVPRLIVRITIEVIYEIGKFRERLHRIFCAVKESRTL